MAQRPSVHPAASSCMLQSSKAGGIGTCTYKGVASSTTARPDATAAASPGLVMPLPTPAANLAANAHLAVACILLPPAPAATATPRPQPRIGRPAS